MAVLGTHLARMVRAIFAQLGASSRSDLQFHSSYDRGWGRQVPKETIKGLLLYCQTMDRVMEVAAPGNARSFLQP